MKHYNRAESFTISRQHLDNGKGCIRGYFWATENWKVYSAKITKTVTALYLLIWNFKKEKGIFKLRKNVKPIKNFDSKNLAGLYVGISRAKVSYVYVPCWDSGSIPVTDSSPVRSFTDSWDIISLRMFYIFSVYFKKISHILEEFNFLPLLGIPENLSLPLHLLLTEAEKRL